ncbi:MAG: 50S ribosomal protein L32 [Acidipropionibacterium sp.]|jgi:large subunit ribosomal protein L32|nr:50S ribosomal protein L32 [Acidipropionibacterium sp.]
MAVPKRKMSRANTRHRRSQWKAQSTQLVPIVVNGRRIQVPRHLVKAYQTGLIDPDD